MPSDDNIDRRTFIKGASGAAAGSAMAGQASAEEFDAADADEDALHEVIITFESREAVDRLDELSLPTGYYKFKALPYGYAKLTTAQVSTVASWPQTVYIEENHEVPVHNADAREATNAAEVQTSQYTGESTHVAVIDSGVDGDHPALVGNLEHNFRFQNPFETEMWRDIGPVNSGGSGHGTHVSGTIAAEENPANAGSDDYGMAPDATLTVYSTATYFPNPAYAGSLGLIGIVGAYDDIIARQRAGETDIQVINNSYGAGAGADYNPTAALQRATWEAYQEGILCVFSAGNSGPDANTMGNFAAGPHVMSSAATDDSTKVTEFSSRGRKPSYSKGGDGANYDRKAAFEQIQTYFENGPYVSEETKVGGGDRTGTLGVAGRGLLPGLVNGPLPATPSTPVTGSTYEKLEPPEAATLINLSVGWTPKGADNDLYLRKGSKDGEIVASSTGFVNANPEFITTTIEGGTTYWMELRPFANAVAQYDMAFSFYNVPRERIPERPFGVHRPATGTPGKLVMSTMAPEDPLQTYAGVVAALQAEGGEEPTAADDAAESGQKPFYSELSGTSMSGPVLSGCAALVFDAYRQEHLEWPDPIDVINTIEATAIQSREDHLPYNIGAGFVDIEAAVKRAVEDDLATFDEVDLVSGKGEVDADADRVGAEDEPKGPAGGTPEAPAAGNADD